MNKKETGGNAFPVPGDQQDETFNCMTLRDYFAGQAMMAALDARDKGYYQGDDDDMATCAYQMADAMLEARK